MLDRRDFVLSTAAGALLASSSLCAMDAGVPIRPMGKRLIPGTKESLSLVGLGNSSAFTAPDLSAASALIDLYTQHGGGYIDLQSPSALNVGKITQQQGTTDKVFFANYLAADQLVEAQSNAKALASAQGKPALDLANSRDVRNFRAQAKNYRALKEQGLARYIGLARVGPQAIQAMEGYIQDGLLDFVQINYSMLEPGAADRLLPLAQDQGVAVVVNRPFVNGKYFELVRGVPLPEWAAEFDCHSWAQFSLKYSLAHPAVTCVLTETTNLNHAQDNFGAGSGRLPDAKTQKRMKEVIQGLS